MLIKGRVDHSNARVFRTLLAWLFFAWVSVQAFAQGRLASRNEIPQLNAEQWRVDLRYFAEQMPKRHKNLFHAITQEQFTNAVWKLDGEIPFLNRDQIVVALARIIAMVGDLDNTRRPVPKPSE